MIKNGDLSGLGKSALYKNIYHNDERFYAALKYSPVKFWTTTKYT